MKVVFSSIQLNHHQQPVSDELASRVNYTFVVTGETTEEQRKLGYGVQNEPNYVCHWDKEPERAERHLREADVVISGSSPERLIRPCVLRKQLLFRYSERPLKHGMEPLKYIPRFLRWHWRNPPGKPIYLLCASAYTALDYSKFGLFRHRAYKWGYFPETRRYQDLNCFFQRKDPTRILWVGRFLRWKHPDDVIEVARHLKEDGCSFQLDFIGIGELEPLMRQRIAEYHLEDCVNLLGAMKPEQVREQMEQAGIFLFTSDRQEGWGAVLNESMNSGCAVVASHAIGSVPYLVKDGENGLVYESGNVELLYQKAKYLLEHPEEQQRLGKAAYGTIVGEWNAEVAAERFVNLAEHILAGEKSPDLYQSGPCSRAEIIEESWFEG